MALRTPDAVSIPKDLTVDGGATGGTSVVADHAPPGDAAQIDPDALRLPVSTSPAAKTLSEAHVTGERAVRPHQVKLRLDGKDVAAELHADDGKLHGRHRQRL